jgi:hypothetical protein
MGVHEAGRPPRLPPFLEQNRAQVNGGWGMAGGASPVSQKAETPAAILDKTKPPVLCMGYV